MKTQPNPLVLKHRGVWVRQNDLKRADVDKDLDPFESGDCPNHEWHQLDNVRWCRLCGAEEVE